MKRFGLAFAIWAWCAVAAFAQVGGLSFPGPGTPHSTSGFSVTAQGTTGSAGSGSSTTLASWTYGSGCNTVLVGVTWGPTTSATITSLKLDGSQSMTAVSGSFFDNSTNGFDEAQFFFIANPTGSSGTPTITFSAGLTNGVALQAWCIITTTTTPTAGNGNGLSANATSVSAAVIVPSGGAVFGMCTGNGGVTTWAFTNIATDNNIAFHNQFGTGNAGSGHATGGTGASVNVTCADVALDSSTWVLSVAAVAP